MSTNRVLVIEDDPLIRQLLVKQLRDLDKSMVDVAADGDTASQILQAAPRYELIIADLMLPGQDAIELLRAVNSQQPQASLILISALDESVLRSVAVLCRTRGQRVLGALRKPIRPEALAQLVRRLPTVTSHSSENRPGRAPDVMDLHRALDMHTIQALVQPIISADDERLLGVEVLAHWNDPGMGPVAASRLAQLADGNGLSTRLTHYILGIALRSCADWRAAGLDIPVAINLSGGVLHDLQMPDMAQRMLTALRLPPELLTLEIGESAELQHANTLEVLSRIRMRGIGVALDHFGRGLTSAAQLQRLPVTNLKIDRSFVIGLPNNAIGRTVVEYAVQLSQALGIDTTAVGVETAEQSQILKTLGCKRLQGYWVGKPMQLEDLPAWIHARKLSPPTADKALSEDATNSAGMDLDIADNFSSPIAHQTAMASI